MDLEDLLLPSEPAPVIKHKPLMITTSTREKPTNSAETFTETLDMDSLLNPTMTLRVVKKPWMTTGEYTLCRVTNDTLTSVIDECIASGRYALDLETTGLDVRVFDGTTRSKIVGCCLSPDGKRGYYIPLRHKTGIEHNVSWTRWVQEMLRLVQSPAIAVFHNGKFDQEFLQFCEGGPIGEWDDPDRWDDTLILAYLRDTRSKQKGLKFLANKELGMEMIELDELFPKKEKGQDGYLDFSELDPSRDPVIWYGASDAICTWNLYPKLAPSVLRPDDGVPGQGTVYKIEKMCVAATRWMERARILTDQEKAKELIRIGQREWFSALQDVFVAASEIVGRDITPGYYRLLLGQVPGYENLKFDVEQVQPGYMERVDTARDVASKKGLDPTVRDGKKVRIETITKRYPSLKEDTKGQPEDVNFPVVYDILSAQSLGLLLRECKVPGLTLTGKSEQVATDKDELERILDDAGDKYPFAGKIKKFRDVSKALGTYLLPLIEDCAPDHTIKATFNAFTIDTGRFNAPSSKNPKVDGGSSFPWHGTPATYDPKRPECMARIRECVISRPGKIMTAIDFSGVELRIVTNMSREPKWLREFFHCTGCDKMFPTGDGTATPEAPPPFCPDCGSDKIGDLHTLTGISIFGADAPTKPEWKKLRGDAKGCNFALAYGGGGNAVVTSIGCDKSEGWRIKELFDKTYTVLKKWWVHQHEYAKRHKFVTTAFGRRYPVPDIDSPEGGFRAKAERNAMNGPIQGGSADITKLAMGICYKECKKRGWLDKVHMLITMHDELVFEIDLDILEEAIDILVRSMCRNPAILKLGWPVPLTSDVEMGFSWMVPWDLKKIRHKGVCPPELAGCFKGVHVKGEEPQTVKSEKKSETKATRIYKLSSFDLGSVEILAKIISATPLVPAKLKIEGPGGEDLTGMFSLVWGSDLPEVDVQ